MIPTLPRVEMQEDIQNDNITILPLTYPILSPVSPHLPTEFLGDFRLTLRRQQDDAGHAMTTSRLIIVLAVGPDEPHYPPLACSLRIGAESRP